MPVAWRWSCSLVVACLASAALATTVETIALPPLTKPPARLEVAARLTSDFIDNQGQWIRLRRDLVRRVLAEGTRPSRARSR